MVSKAALWCKKPPKTLCLFTAGDTLAACRVLDSWNRLVSTLSICAFEERPPLLIFYWPFPQAVFDTQGILPVSCLELHGGGFGGLLVRSMAPRWGAPIVVVLPDLFLSTYSSCAFRCPPQWVGRFSPEHLPGYKLLHTVSDTVSDWLARFLRVISDDRAPVRRAVEML